jgi:hypothetical protein
VRRSGAAKTVTHRQTNKARAQARAEGERASRTLDDKNHRPTAPRARLGVALPDAHQSTCARHGGAPPFVRQTLLKVRNVSYFWFSRTPDSRRCTRHGRGSTDTITGDVAPIISPHATHAVTVFSLAYLQYINHNNNI